MTSNLKIKQLRKEKNISVTELADYLGVKEQTIYAYEKGNAVPPLDKIILLSDFFKISIEELIGLEKKHADLNSNLDLKNQILTFKGVLIGKGYWQELEPYYPKYRQAV